MTANEFCVLQQCRNIGCSHLHRDKDLCTKVQPPRKPGEVRRGIDCDMQTPRWSIKDCRAKKCEHLKNTSGYGDAQERCHALQGDNSIMPGTLTHCIQDLEHMPAEEFLHCASWSLATTREREGQFNRKTPGPKNCPNDCPYKISAETAGKKKTWTCAFTGVTLGGGGACHCHVLDNPDQEHQIEILKGIVQSAAKPAAGHLQCGGESCPRLGELLFKGGSKSAKVLMEETQRDRCKEWIPRPSKEELRAEYGEPMKPHMGYCGAKGCEHLDWEGGICQACNLQIKDIAVCPKPAPKKKSTSRKSKTKED